MKNKKLEANLSMAVSKIFSGLNMNALKYLLPLWMSPLTGATLRCTFAAAAFWVIGWFMPPEKSSAKDKWLLFLLGAFGLYGFMFLYPAEFGAKVYKIARDNQGNRLTYLKVTGGRLKVKDVVEGLNEKINQIRIYSGEKFEAVQKVEAGRVCAVTGLENTRLGQGIGAEEESDLPVLEPVLTYQILLPDDCE